MQDNHFSYKNCYQHGSSENFSYSLSKPTLAHQCGQKTTTLSQLILIELFIDYDIVLPLFFPFRKVSVLPLTSKISVILYTSHPWPISVAKKKKQQHCLNEY